MVKKKEKAYASILWLVECLSWRQFFPQFFSHEAIIKAILGLRLKKPTSRTNHGITLQLQSTFFYRKKNAYLRMLPYRILKGFSEGEGFVLYQ